MMMMMKLMIFSYVWYSIALVLFSWGGVLFFLGMDSGMVLEMV